MAKAKMPSSGSPDDVPVEHLAALALMLIVLVGIVYVAVSSYYTVQAAERAVILRFGKYVRTSGPGLHFRIPVIESVYIVSVAENSLRLPNIDGSRQPQTAMEEPTLKLTADLNMASVEWTVQWRVVEPERFLFAFNEVGERGIVERVISTEAITVMNKIVGDYSFDEVFTNKREEMQLKALELMQERLARYDCGVEIEDLQLQKSTPGKRVEAAFSSINTSIQKKQQLESEAITEQNRLLAEARAESDKLIREAEGYAQRRYAEAAGEISALRSKYRAYQTAPDITRERLYLEAMEEVLAGVGTKIILDADLRQLLPLLQIPMEPAPVVENQ